MWGVEKLAEQAALDLDVTFPQIVTFYGSAIHTTALRVSLRHDDAEDLAAETFIRAYQALQTYPPKRIRELQLRAWLVTITLNLWRNQLRDASRRPSLVQLDFVIHRSDPADGPEQRALDVEGSDRVSQLLASLPESERIPIILRHVVGLSYKEIATVLDCPIGTAKSHVSRGIATLRANLYRMEEATP